MKKRNIITVEIFSVSLRSFGDKLVGMFFVVDQLAISASRAIASLAEQLQDFIFMYLENVNTIMHTYYILFKAGGSAR